jgi:predicted kinase
MLILLGGLPGVGKTTIARALAQRLGATYVRIDEIEQALRASGLPEIGPAGYGVANALAASNLANGQNVVADCVNPVPESRQGWRDTAARVGAPLLEVALICSDSAEHRRRVETRRADIAGHSLPDWPSVIAQEFSDWPEAHLLIDTAIYDVEASIGLILQRIGR